MTSWEERMAVRAAVRRAERIDLESARLDREWEEWRSSLDARGWASVAGMTLGEATRLLRSSREFPIACACVGPPYCCRYGYRQAEALQRAAHIAVKIVTTLIEENTP